MTEVTVINLKEQEMKEYLITYRFKGETKQVMVSAITGAAASEAAFGLVHKRIKIISVEPQNNS